MKRASVILALPLALAAAGLAAPAQAQPSHCPPGLAKKNPPCVPPGQVGRRGDDRYDRDHYRDDDRDRDEDRAYREGYRDGYRVAVGELLERGDYRLVEDPRRYGFAPYGTDAWRYYLVRDTLVRADPDTRRILDVIGLASVLLR